MTFRAATRVVMHLFVGGKSRNISISSIQQFVLIGLLKYFRQIRAAIGGQSISEFRHPRRQVRRRV